MKLRPYQHGEFLGILLVLASVATQMFYLDPLQREIDWRRVAFNVQQTGEVQTRAGYDNTIALLKAMKSQTEDIRAVEAAREATLAKFGTASANVADYVIETEPVQSTLEWAVIALFGLGTLLTGLGRVFEMTAHSRE